MAYRFHRTLLLRPPLRLVKNSRSTRKLSRSFCTCTVKEDLFEPIQSKPSPRDCLPIKRSFVLTARRGHQTLSSDFGAHLPSVKQMENFLSARKILFEHGHTSLIACCPFCTEGGDGSEKTKAFTLYINKTTGSHFCKNCNASGTWQKFKDNLTDSDADQTSQIWDNSTPISMCSDVLLEKLRAQFPIKELRQEILEKFRIRFTEREFKGPNGKTKKHGCIVFPWYDVNKSAVKAVKLVKLEVDSASDSSFTIEPRQRFLGLFGWNTVDSEAKEVVLTSTEFDAIAVNQATSYPAISLPMGINSLPPEVLPQLEQFEKIILWFGNDVFSRQAANQFSRKLNLKRCFLVRPTGETNPVNALDALNSGCDLASLVSSAQQISHDKITTFHQLRGEVYDQFVNADQVAGVKWTRFPQLNSILKGMRRGEVTVFTGPTGAGKTTLLSEMSLDLCMQGVNTLWGSFEIRNVRLVKMMLCQYSGLNLEKDVDKFQYWADKFEMLPMYFMCFYGAQNINTVIETMSHAAYVYDIEHVIVDNLQFMTSYLSRGDDRFSAQNHVIAALRNFASTKNVHVTLVIHPRKENDDVELQTASIFGTAKASQEADNVIILQSKTGTAQKYLQVTKNRFDGVLGRVPLDFVRESLSMSGYGKQIPPNRTLSLAKRRPEKLKATRLTGDVDVVKFSAPKIISPNKVVERNLVSPQAAHVDNVTRSNTTSTTVVNNELVGIEKEGANDAAAISNQPGNGLLDGEKKETVQRTVKKILSGTRLFTKAVPRNNYNRSGLTAQQNRPANLPKLNG